MMSARQKILVVFGTRPEAIKLAPGILSLQAEIRAETIERSLGLFPEILSNLSRDSWWGQELDRSRHADNPLPPGAEPIRKKVHMLVGTDTVRGHPAPEDALTREFSHVR